MYREVMFITILPCTQLIEDDLIPIFFLQGLLMSGGKFKQRRDREEEDQLHESADEPLDFPRLVYSGVLIKTVLKVAHMQISQ